MVSSTKQIHREAEARLYDENEYKARIFSDLLSIGYMTVFRYLTEIKDTVMVVGQRHPDLPTLLIMSPLDREKAESGRIYLEIGQITALLDYNNTPLEIDLDLKERIGYYDSIFFKSYISGLRSTALLYRHITGKEPAEDYKKEFIQSLAKEYDASLVEYPPSLHLILTSEYREALQSFQKRSEAFVQRSLDTYIEKQKAEVEEEIQRGCNQRIVLRKLKVKEQKLAVCSERMHEETVTALDNLFAEFPDPRVLIDLVLDLKNGKMPI